MIKLVACLRRLPGMDKAAFHRYWRHTHGPLVMSVTEFSRHVRKYVQGHTVDDPAPGFPPPTEPPYDGVAELWFDDLAAIGTAFAEPQYMAIIRPDELKFLDLANCRMTLVEEALIAG